MDLRGFAMLLQKCREDFLRLSEFLLPQIGEAKRHRRLAVVRLEPLRLQQFQLCRIETIHAEIKLAQQLPRLRVHGLLRQKCAHGIHALLKLAFAEIDHRQTEQSCVGIGAGCCCALVCGLGLFPISQGAVGVAQLLERQSQYLAVFAFSADEVAIPLRCLGGIEALLKELRSLVGVVWASALLRRGAFLGGVRGGSWAAERIRRVRLPSRSSTPSRAEQQKHAHTRRKAESRAHNWHSPPFGTKTKRGLQGELASPRARVVWIRKEASTQVESPGDRAPW